MKLATYRPADAQSPLTSIGAVLDDSLVDLNYAYARYLRDIEGEVRAYALADARIPRDMVGFLEGGEGSTRAAQQAIAFLDGGSPRGISGERLRYALDEIRLLAPIPRPGKILAVGKNYADHVAEGSQAKGLPAKSAPSPDSKPFPRGFVKVSSVVVGPDEPVRYPHVTDQLDYEVELAVVIGKRGRYIPRSEAYSYVAGYSILNDVSARDIQLSEAKMGNHMIGKNMDSMAPLGPWLVLADEIPDPMNLDLRLLVNGQERQASNTSNMIHDIPAIIERWSWMTLEPGDIIATGTPAGVAMGGQFPYLSPGDLMECTISGLGTLRNRISPEDFE